MYLYLVRHGQSVGNERGVFYGLSDHPLTDLGREQALQAAEKLREVSFTRCVASDLSRAWDTALICAEGRGVAVEADPRLREQDMGEMEERVGAAVDELVARGEDVLLVAHGGTLSLILSHFGLAKESELMNSDYNWFFTQGAYSAIRVDENGAELVCFNR